MTLFSALLRLRFSSLSLLHPWSNPLLKDPVMIFLPLFHALLPELEVMSYNQSFWRVYFDNYAKELYYYVKELCNFALKKLIFSFNPKLSLSSEKGKILCFLISGTYITSRAQDHLEQGTKKYFWTGDNNIFVNFIKIIILTNLC